MQSLTIAHQPNIKYLLPSPEGYVPADASLCQTPMRLTRCEARPSHGPAFTYGAYFKAIRDVISKDGHKLLVHATERRLARKVLLSDMEAVLIYGEKHGSDYHPARIEVWAQGACVSFVMNVAVSARGKVRLCHEYDVLRHLDRKFVFSFLPHPYFYGEASCHGGHDGETDTLMTMFLADWFEGYHEFHLSMDKATGSQRLVMWDADKGNPSLSRQQAWELYRQGAMILTLYYDIETFEQIFPWHHAAGDFVVRAEDDGLDMKLVTARQYGPMVDPCQGVSAYEALLLFLLNLSMRMRLDRLDGVGAVAWADSECVGAIVKGFVDGLRMKEQEGMIPRGFVNAFLRQCASFARRHLSERFHALVDACDPGAPDMPVIRRCLGRHIQECHLTLQEESKSQLA
ncbi:MAG: hypothetical protein SWH78_05100 [Thermodesulfobacteriota bacterium]|nr:hypothetical protein [Thermodesulfobacteriota bacterium]